MVEIHLTLGQTQQGGAGCVTKKTGQKIKMIVGIDGKKAALVMVADIERLQLPTAILCLFFRPIGQYHDTLPTINFQSVKTPTTIRHHRHHHHQISVRHDCPILNPIFRSTSVPSKGEAEK